MARWRILMGAPTAAMGRPRMSHRSLNSSTSRGSTLKQQFLGVARASFAMESTSIPKSNLRISGS